MLTRIEVRNMTTVFWLVMIAMLATLVVLLVGLVFMAIGGKLDKKYASTLMLIRVVCQATAIGLICVLFAMKHSA